MSKNNSYAGTTTTLSIENRNFDNIIYEPTKPVLDAELNGMTDIISAKLQDMIRSKVPSGWFNADYSLGYDNTGLTYGISTTNTSNTFYICSRRETPLTAVVNGWLINVGGTNSNNDSLIEIELNNPPGMGSREDLVFLEVWKEIIEGVPSTEGKPSASAIYKYGNTEYGGINLLDEIVNPSIGFQTTERVQIQYRIRVVSGVNFINYPEGIDDSANVFAQGGTASPSIIYNFINVGSTWDDYGLYVAGDGSSSAQGNLNTVDGYVYAIPMVRIHRRNSSPYSLTNQNGAGYSLISAEVSDRPDGLFNDQIHAWDIEDLRHEVSFGEFDYQGLLEENFDALCAGQLATCLTENDVDVLTARTNVGIYVNSLSVNSSPGVLNIATPNGQQRYYSDVPKAVTVTEKRTISQKYTGIQGGHWIPLDQIQITIKNFSPTGTLIDLETPLVKTNLNGIITDVIGSWSGLGTTQATFTLGTNISGFTTQNIYISYEIDYPQNGYRLTKPVTEILKVTDVTTNLNWGWVSADAEYHNRNKNIPIRITNGYTDTGSDYQLGAKNGAGTVITYYVNGNNTQTCIIPGSILSVVTPDLLYIYSIYDISSMSYVNPLSIQRDPTTYNLAVTLNYTVYSGQTLKFELALIGSILEYDERTLSIADMGTVSFYEIMGNGTNSIILENCLAPEGDPSNIVIGGQGMLNISDNFLNYCYVTDMTHSPYTGFLQPCTCTITPNTNLIKLQFVSVIPSTSKITIALLTNETLAIGETLDIYYLYSEYKGITGKLNFGTTSASEINSKIMYHNNDLQIVTNGTGAVNTAEFLAKSYEPLIPKLPIVNVAYDGFFTGTIHKSKIISGGSYTLETSYPAPYASGKSNYMNKNGVNQKRGTYKGGYATTAIEPGELGIAKLIVGALLEMVVNDGTKNFLPGELALKVETNYLYNTPVNRITNFDSGNMTNSFDMFKIKGRPLVKVVKD